MTQGPDVPSREPQTFGEEIIAWIRLDRDDVPRPRGRADWSADPTDGVAARRDPEKLRQPARN
jgi:hypothetical protein